MPQGQPIQDGSGAWYSSRTAMYTVLIYHVMTTSNVKAEHVQVVDMIPFIKKARWFTSPKKIHGAFGRVKQHCKHWSVQQFKDFLTIEASFSRSMKKQLKPPLPSPPTMPLKSEALKLYSPPFRYEHGYILDSKGEMVADGGGPSAMIARICGWGRIQKMNSLEQLQDTVGEMIAEALNEYWQSRKNGLVVRNAVVCGICGSPADRYVNWFECQANPCHMGDLNVGIFSDLTPPEEVKMSTTKIENAFSTWRKAMEKEAEFGACDTEPMYHASKYLRAGILNDDPPVLPTTAQGWELYTSEPGVQRAAQRLTTATRKLKNALMKCPIEDLPFIKKCVGRV